MVTVGFIGAGVVVSALVCLPDWGFLNRSPVQWLPAEAANETSSSAADAKGGKGKKKRA